MPGYEVLGSEELEEVKDVFNSGGVLFRHGFDEKRKGCYKVKAFESEFAKFLKCDYTLAVTSGTAALRVALAALDIGKGDEVITQAFTFVATVEAIIEAQATPVCVNIDNSLNINPKEIEASITNRTKAVIVVHMLGVPSKLKEVKEICRKYNLALIEDTAWGCGGKFDNKALGTYGDIGTFSFDFAKTMTTGEGGMIAFKDKVTYEKACAWHDHGHENNPNLPRWKDSRSGSGFNFRMMELQAAVGLAQLRKLPMIVSAQRKNSDLIWSYLEELDCIERREEPIGCMPTADALIFMVETEAIALKIREKLLSRRISTKILPEAITWHFAGTWDHMPELVNRHDNKLKESLRKSEIILTRSVSIPIGVELDDKLPEAVHAAIIEGIE